jgi:hypothetical protein
VTDATRAADSGIPHAAVLVALAEAAAGTNDGTLAEARAAVLQELGGEPLIDAAAVVANFGRMVRVADATGTPLDLSLMLVSETLRTRARSLRRRGDDTPTVGRVAPCRPRGRAGCDGPVPALGSRARTMRLSARLAACGGFLLAVLWFDLMFDVQVLGHAAAPAPLPDDTLASIARYYARVTGGAHPMQVLVALVMATAVLGSLWRLAHTPRTPHAWIALLLAALPIGLAHGAERGAPRHPRRHAR